MIGEVDRLSILISRLLTLTRLEEERLNREHLTLSDIVADTVRVMTSCRFPQRNTGKQNPHGHKGPV